jgi:hypothetical protein
LIISLQYHFGGVAIIGQNDRSTSQWLLRVTIGNDTANRDNDRSDVKRIYIVVVLFIATVTAELSFIGVAFKESDTEVITP